jgi:hypothetical protein
MEKFLGKGGEWSGERISIRSKRRRLTAGGRWHERSHERVRGE